MLGLNLVLGYLVLRINGIRLARIDSLISE